MSLNQQFGFDLGGEAAADLAANVGVVLAADGTVNTPASAGDKITGVTARRAGVGEQTQIIVSGIVPIKIKTAGTLAVGDYVAAEADGEFVALTTGAEAGAKLLQAPAADGDIVTAYVDFIINEQGA